MTDSRQIALEALKRMDRARAILTNDKPSHECNWGMLDTSDLRAALEADMAQVVEPDYEAMYTRGFKAFDCPVCGFDGALGFEPSAGEPVAWVNRREKLLFLGASIDAVPEEYRKLVKPLFDAPQQAAINVELLEALDTCSGTLTACFPDAPVDSVIGKNIIEARAAIAKATGATT